MQVGANLQRPHRPVQQICERLPSAKDYEGLLSRRIVLVRSIDEFHMVCDDVLRHLKRRTRLRIQPHALPSSGIAPKYDDPESKENYRQESAKIIKNILGSCQNDAFRDKLVKRYVFLNTLPGQVCAHLNQAYLKFFISNLGLTKPNGKAANHYRHRKCRELCDAAIKSRMESYEDAELAKGTELEKSLIKNANEFEEKGEHELACAHGRIHSLLMKLQTKTKTLGVPGMAFAGGGMISLTATIGAASSPVIAALLPELVVGGLVCLALGFVMVLTAGSRDKYCWSHEYLGYMNSISELLEKNPREAEDRRAKWPAIDRNEETFTNNILAYMETTDETRVNPLLDKIDYN